MCREVAGDHINEINKSQTIKGYTILKFIIMEPAEVGGSERYMVLRDT